jgi:SAM-dependent methyltransferase
MSTDPLLEPVREYYGEKLRCHGATAAGVDWNSAESQRLRFEQLLRVVASDRTFSILDFGCGYGALVEELVRRGWNFEYFGYDISHQMLERAHSLYGGDHRCSFLEPGEPLPQVDYVVASGVFNVKLEAPAAAWGRYVARTVGRLHGLAAAGVAFNLLTLRSDPERRRPQLYYASPENWFARCARLSRHVALLHDYPLYEFTMLVRKTL